MLFAAASWEPGMNRACMDDAFSFIFGAERVVNEVFFNNSHIDDCIFPPLENFAVSYLVVLSKPCSRTSKQ